MAMTYVNIQDRVEQILQDTSATTYTTTMTGMWIEDALKEFSPYDPHIVPIVFQIESRTGTDDTGLASSVSDTAKSQFVAADATQEKVVHNTTDDTWAVVLANTNTTANTLSADIMDENESYEIYNRRCWNNKQIYLGNWGDYQWNIVNYLWVDSVEYPIGTKRNWKVYNDVLEIDVDSVDDSDSTLTTLGQVDVLVRFAMPHRLLQLTDTHGAIFKDEDAGAVAFPVKGFTDGQICEVGDEFHFSNHRTLYSCTEQITWSNQSSAGSVLHFYPPLEADSYEDDYVNFIVSTLKPHHEELFCHLVAARAVLSQNITNIDAINKGGTDVWLRYQNWGERKLAEVIGKMEALSPPRTKRRYATA